MAKIQTTKDAVEYIKRALVWSKVDLSNINPRDLPGILEAYDVLEPVSQEEADLIMRVVMATIEVKLAKARYGGM